MDEFVMSPEGAFAHSHPHTHAFSRHLTAPGIFCHPGSQSFLRVDDMGTDTRNFSPLCPVAPRPVKVPKRGEGQCGQSPCPARVPKICWVGWSRHVCPLLDSGGKAPVCFQPGHFRRPRGREVGSGSRRGESRLPPTSRRSPPRACGRVEGAQSSHEATVTSVCPDGGRAQL